MDKAAWGQGSWSVEPDRDEFTAHGLRCYVLRHPSLGSLNGYCEVPVVLQGMKRLLETLDAHGGVTFGPDVLELDVPGVTLIGFDTGHYLDLVPSMMGSMPADLRAELTYRNLAYVRAEAASLAEQVAKLFERCKGLKPGQLAVLEAGERLGETTEDFFALLEACEKEHPC